MDDDEFKSMSVSLMIIISIITVFLNSICIAVILKSKVLLKRPSTYFILNLLLVHFFQGVLTFPFYAAKKWRVESPGLSQIICDGFRFTYMCTFYGAIMAVFLIAADRLVATCFVLRYREIVTKQRVFIVTFITWVYVIVLCSLPFGIHDNKATSQSLSNASMANHTRINLYKCFYEQSQTWTISMLLVNCMLPYLLIIIFYYRILIHINIIQTRTERAHKLTTTTLVSTPDNRQHGVSKTANTPKIERTPTWRREEQKQYNAMTRMSLIMGISYLFFWLPSVIYYVILRACPDSCFPTGWSKAEAENYVSFFTKFMAFLDAISTPIIYCIMSGEFRKHVPWKEKHHQPLIDTRTNDTGQNTTQYSVNNV